MRIKRLFILGSLVLIVAGCIFLVRMRRLGYVDCAIGTLRTLVASETEYAQTHPQLGYTCSISTLPSDKLTAELVRQGTRLEYSFEIGGCLVGE